MQFKIGTEDAVKENQQDCTRRNGSAALLILIDYVESLKKKD